MTIELLPFKNETPMYLDTSAVRALSGKRELFSGGQVFTSILTILELLDGCEDEIEYRKRKAALETMFSAKLAIAPEMPLVNVAKSFAEIAANYTILNTEAETMMRLAHQMLATHSV